MNKRKCFYYLWLLSTFLLVSGCQNKQEEIIRNQTREQSELTLLKSRIDRLEKKIGYKAIPKKTRSKEDSSKLIKSITFRIGTKDDRLRIYWSDGSNSDMPCTKEQSIWICG